MTKRDRSEIGRSFTEYVADGEQSGSERHHCFTAKKDDWQTADMVELLTGPFVPSLKSCVANDSARVLATPVSSSASVYSFSVNVSRDHLPTYPATSPAKAWDLLRLHFGLIVQQAAFDLNLPLKAVAAAVSAFHTVFPGHFTREELENTPQCVSRCMAACLFLAGKTSETNLKLREAVNCIDFLQWKLKQQQRKARALEEQNNAAISEVDKCGTLKADARSASSSHMFTQQERNTVEEKNRQHLLKSEASDLERKTGGAVPSDKSSPTAQTHPTKNIEKGGSQSDSPEAEKKSSSHAERSSNNSDSSGAAAGVRSSSNRAGGTGKCRSCGISLFFRTSSFLKGYVPMGIREYWQVRQECLREEERLLQALGFSLPLPYFYDILLEAMPMLLPTHEEAHLIWACANDIAASPLLEHFSPPVLIAAAALYAKKLIAIPNALASEITVSASLSGRAVSQAYSSSQSLLTASSSSSFGSPLQPSGIYASSSHLYRKNEHTAAPIPAADERDVDGATTTAEIYTDSRTKARRSMLDVIDRLYSLLCCSQEYWTMLKSDERRRLVRGGSRWAKALPSAAWGWKKCEATSVREEENLKKCIRTKYGNFLPVAVELQGGTAPADAEGHESRQKKEKIYPSVVRDDGEGFAGVVDVGHHTGTTEEGYYAERGRLQEEERAEERERKVVYVQVAEVCARLLQFYSLLQETNREDDLI